MNIEYKCEPHVDHEGFDHCILMDSKNFIQYREYNRKVLAVLGPVCETWNDSNLLGRHGFPSMDDPSTANWLIVDLVPLTLRFKNKSDAMMAKLLA